MRALVFLVLLLTTLTATSAGQTNTNTDLNAVLERMSGYVARYGEKASAIVAVERYTQSITAEGRAPIKPRSLVAEFAIVRIAGGWAGYRDVFEVDGEKIQDRSDRFATLLARSTDQVQLARISDESARFNIGPISRNFNVPTAALFFFQPANLSRFTFSHKGREKIDGVDTVEIAFKETTTPTFIATRSGKNVPMDGSLWVVPETGVVVRTRLRLRKFLDSLTWTAQGAPAARPAPNPNVPTGGRQATAAPQSATDVSEINSEAQVDVTYRHHKEFDLWLPAKMSEFYIGPLVLRAGAPPESVRASTQATYSDFKQFTTGVTIK